RTGGGGGGAAAGFAGAAGDTGGAAAEPALDRDSASPSLRSISANIGSISAFGFAGAGGAAAGTGVPRSASAEGSVRAGRVGFAVPAAGTGVAAEGIT